MGNKIFNLCAIAVFFAMGSFGFYKWINTNLIPENDLVMTKGKIVDVSHSGDNNRDIIIRLDNRPELFRFYGRFPKYEEVESVLRVDNMVSVWHSPKPNKTYAIYRIDASDKTIFSYADIAESYDNDLKKVFYGSVTWSVAFIVALTRYIINEKKLRANQSLSEGVPSGQADSREHKNVIAQRAIQICLRVQFSARRKFRL